MLTDPELRSKVDQLWEKLWSGGLSNPLDAIEQFSYLLFLKRLEDEENRREKRARNKGQAYAPRVPEFVLWSQWSSKKAELAHEHIKEQVFPYFRSLKKEQDETGQQQSSFAEYMQTAEFKINKPSLLIEACNLINQMNVSQQNQDVQGDLYEYMLSKLSTAGRNGQFRTPRHIIRMMIEMIEPKVGERIGDLAAGTGGFLVNAYQYILATHTDPELLHVDEAGEYHNLVGDLLTDENREWLQNDAFRGYDNDSGMTMLRIGSMNLMLHGLDHPHFYYKDTLSRDYDEPSDYDVILMNPPFKGAVDKNEGSEQLPNTTTKTELLFLHQILRVLDMGGRAAVIVPDGVLFGSSNAHVEVRRKLIEENRLDGVVSMPSGVFKPYAGVSTAVLLFTKGGTTNDIWFYDMANDGFSLDDKRQPTPDRSDIPDILQSWKHRHDKSYTERRVGQLAEQREVIIPMQEHRLKLEREINRLRFEQAVADRDDAATREALAAAQAELDHLRNQIQPIKGEIDRLTRQFWVTKAQAKANKYDLSASRYRALDQEPVFYENPQVTLERMLVLERSIAESMQRIQERLGR